jgi:hypothetical protein
MSNMFLWKSAKARISSACSYTKLARLRGWPSVHETYRAWLTRRRVCPAVTRFGRIRNCRFDDRSRISGGFQTGLVGQHQFVR